MIKAEVSFHGASRHTRVEYFKMGYSGNKNYSEAAKAILYHRKNDTSMTVQVVIDLEALKRLRDHYGYSISDMASKLGYKTPTGYWLIEQGQRKVSIDTLYRLSKIYNCAMEELITTVPDNQ